MLKKKIWANFQRIIELFTQKIITKLSKIWVWDPGSEIRDPEKTYPGSRGQKGTGSQIRIRNTAFFKTPIVTGSCLYMIATGKWGACEMLTPSHSRPNPQFRLARVAKTGGLLLLVEGREEMRALGAIPTHLPWMGTVNAIFSYHLLGNEPICGSHFSILLYTLPVKEYKG